jgi:DNA polymerase-3 subunit beta
MAAADGFVLSKATEPIGGAGAKVVVPARALDELVRVLKASGPQFGPQESPVGIALTRDEHQVLFHLDNVELVSQLIEGQFPDHEAIVPTTHTTRVTANAAALAKACRVANVFARENGHMLTFGAEPGRLAISAVSAESGDSVGSVDADVEGEPIEIRFSAKYMLAVLSKISGDIVLEMTTPASPVLIRSTGDERHCVVLMPMVVEEKNTTT